MSATTYSTDDARFDLECGRIALSTMCANLENSYNIDDVAIESARSVAIHAFELLDHALRIAHGEEEPITAEQIDMLGLGRWAAGILPGDEPSARDVARLLRLLADDENEEDE